VARRRERVAATLLTLVLLRPGDPETVRRTIPVAVAAALHRAARERAVNARPWARVRIDGRDLGPTPLSQRLAPGVYRLEAHFPDGQTIHRNIEVSPERRFVSLP
jgi:hypothetical protein